VGLGFVNCLWFRFEYLDVLINVCIRRGLSTITCGTASVSSAREDRIASSDRGISCLVVDDFEPWRCYVRSKLGITTTYWLCEATDGAEAVQKATELKPDLILLDVGLPDMNGIEVAKRIRQNNPSSRIVFATLTTTST
jgi:PleD family two-component response regulator